MIPAEELKARLSMHDVAVRYGFQPDRSSCIKCPFHADTDPSLHIYTEPGRGFYCYSCNVGGSVIDFVMRLFNLGYRQALLRLNGDFGFGGIPTNQDALDRLRAKREKQKQTEQNKQNELTELAAEHCRLHRALITGPEWSEAWCEALMNMADINYRMEVLDCPN